MVHCAAVLSLSAACLAGSHALPAQEGHQHPDHHAPDQLGSLEFPTSAATVRGQELFERGMLNLHSFEYDEARMTFRELREKEPDLAIAAWGEALTHYRPIWKQEDLKDARAVLAALGDTREARAAKAGSDVERGLLGAVEVLFAEGSRSGRWVGYADAMGALSKRHPHHTEIGALHCLAILGTSLDGRDTRTYMRAAAVGQHFYMREPRHPGLLHYLIHCYDDPIHAPLGLPMARAYDQVAPDAEHALHMPSHIYLALGMWPETVAANIRSVAAADKRVARMGWTAERRGWHAFLWQGYGHLQLGETKAARAMLKEAYEHAHALPEQRIRFHFCHLRSVYAMDTRDFGDPLVAAEMDLTGIRNGVYAMERWVRGQVLLNQGDIDGCRALVKALEEETPDLRRPSGSVIAASTGAASAQAPAESATCCAPTPSYGPSRQATWAALVTIHLLRGAIAERTGDPNAAMEHLKEAVACEAEMQLDFGPPESIPANEELARFLEHHGGMGSVPYWRAALERAPGRRIPAEQLKRPRR